MLIIPLLKAVGGLGFGFCVFVVGWRHALRSEWPFIIITPNSVPPTNVLYVTNAPRHEGMHVWDLAGIWPWFSDAGA